MFGRGKSRRRPLPSLCESGETEEAEWEEAAGDYVFRIVNNAITDREGEFKILKMKCFDPYIFLITKDTQNRRLSYYNYKQILIKRSTFYKENTKNIMLKLYCYV